MNLSWNYQPVADSILDEDFGFKLSETLVDYVSNSHTLPKDYELQFYPLDSVSMDFIWTYLLQEKGRTTDFSFLGLLMWVDLFKYEYAIYNDTLFIKGRVENARDNVAFALPVGKMKLSDSIKLLKNYCNKNNIPLEFSAVPEYALPEMMALNPVGVEELTDWGDYLYDAVDLAGLSGKKYSKKRNHVNRFIEENPDWHIERIGASNIKDVLKIMDIYDTQLDDAEMGLIESKYTRQVINNYAKYKNRVLGIILYSGDSPCAFTIGDMKGDTLFVHIEKALRDFSGCYEMINNCFARYITENFPNIRYINREDDSGDPGLRRSKQSYRPIEILKKYNVIF